uniref:C2H2-type domain-containing protein n=1 Tax=Panagrolaimus sp. ES5 TaxID=591445 RepID=A0AC34GVM6_9BILA
MSGNLQDDPTSDMHTMNIGNRGFEGSVKAWNDGTDEVKDLLKYECEMIYECRLTNRFCRSLFRSIPNFLSHKRQYCKTLCRTVTPNTLISKHLEDFTTLYVNDKGTPPTSVKKNVQKGSRHNIVAAFQKRLHTTTISDDSNRVDLYSLPSISRYQPQTTFQDGQQIILRHNPRMAIKEHMPEDGALLIMPQDSNISQKCGDMTLRRRKAVDVEEKEMSGKELLVLDYIPADIRKNINPAQCLCLYDACKSADIKPFESLLALAYHLTVTHNRPLNAKEVLRIRKGREGQLSCFLCGTTHGGIDKLKSHLQKEHSDIRDAHLIQRRQLFDAQNSRNRRKLDPAIYFDTRHRSISPTPSETEEEVVEEAEDSAELPVTESMEIEEQSNDSFLSSNADSQSTSAATSAAIKNGVAAAGVGSEGGKRKFPIIKKKKRPRLTMKRKKPQIPSSSKLSKDDVSPTEGPPKLEKQNIERDDGGEEEMEEAEEKEPEFVGEEEETTSESQNIPELISQTDSTSPPPTRTQTRSPSNESVRKGLAVTRSKRTRVPKKFFDYVPNDLKKGSKSKHGSKEPPKKKPRPAENEFITPKMEVEDDFNDFNMPVLEKEALKSAPLSTKKTPISSKKPTKRRLTSSPVKSASLTPSKASTSKLREVLKSEFDTEGWITPDSSFTEELEPIRSPIAVTKKRLPYTPKAAAAAREGAAGSSRRKQRLNISDDHEGNTPKRLESEEKEERISTKPTDLSLIPIILTPEDEELFYKPLKQLYKIGDDGNHQCSECGTTFLSQKEGRRHMLTHVRAVRFRCALCDVGAFFCEDMRVHLMNRHCPSLHLVPDKFHGSAIPCMTTKEADALTQIVHQECPGQYRYTSGKIVTSENPKPHRPEASIEESILGSIRPPYISPKKERPKVPILSRSNKSPSRLISANGDNANVSSPSKSSSTTVTQNESRVVSPLKLIRTNANNSEASSASASTTASSAKLKLPGFKLLKPASDPTVSNNNEMLDSAPMVEDAAVLETSQSSSSIAAPVPSIAEQQIPTPPPPAAEALIVPAPAVVEIIEAIAEIPPPVPTPPQQQANEDTEPLDPFQPGPHMIERLESIDPVDPSPSF